MTKGSVHGHVGDDHEEDVYYVMGLLIGQSLIELNNSKHCKIHDVMIELAFLHITTQCVCAKATC